MQQILLSVLVSGVVVLGLLLPLWWRFRSAPPNAEGDTACPASEPRWAVPLAGAAAFILVHVLLERAVRLSPAAAIDWLPYTALAAGVLGLIASRSNAPQAFRVMLRSLVLLGCGWASARGLISASWPAATTAAWLAGLVIVGNIHWFTLDCLAGAAPGASAPLTIWVQASGATISLALGMFSMRLGVAAAGLAAAGGAMVLTAWIVRRFTLASGGVAVHAALLSTLLFQALLYSADDVPPARKAILIGLVLVCPAMALAPGHIAALKRGPAWKATLVRFAMAAIPAAAAVAISALYYTQGADPEG